MSRYTFPGYHAFLDAAANELGRPEAALPARRISALSALANLCAQAGEAPDGRAAEVLAKAAEFRDQLHAASRAADLMIAEVSRSLGIKASESARPEPTHPRPARPNDARAKKP